MPADDGVLDSEFFITPQSMLQGLSSKTSRLADQAWVWLFVDADVVASANQETC